METNGTETLRPFHEMWERGQEPTQWAQDTTPNTNLLWKAGHPSQVKDLLAMGHLLNLPVRVVGQHRSKSVGLPVGMFRADVWNEEVVYFITRNNFHDLKIVVAATCPIHISYDVIHRHMTADELGVEKRRSYEYCKTHRDFDPSKYETDAWFDSWCHDTLLRVDGEIYRCGTTHPVYYEGMKQAGLPGSAFHRYEHGRQTFAAEVRGGSLEMLRIMQAVRTSVQATVRTRRDLKCALERQSELSALTSRTPYQEEALREAIELIRAAGIDPDTKQGTNGG